MRHPRPLALALLLASPLACSRDREPRLFELLGPERTGVAFANTITTSDSLNVQSDVYVYNGAGVAVGDVDGDGLADLFFAGNQVSSRLYRNRGGMRFEDVTERAGVATTRWATGASMVDINGDGHLDIYVSVSGPGAAHSGPEDRANLLFVNDGAGTFTEAAARYGVADAGFSTHAAFLDYDGDGCLDLFVLNNSPADFTRADMTAPNPLGVRGETPGSHNELYRNGCPGPFTNVSREAGILRTPGYGLGVAVSDFNRDGRPDIYVSNDAAPNDVIYVNNGDGTLTDRAGRWLKHASVAGMGVDAADVNDDGWPDVLQVDMMPRALSRRKRISGVATHGGVLESRSRGVRDDYSMNTLQLSNGVTKDGDVVFSEIARMAGVAATDWSWSALLADFDNDGRKDVFIGNGYPKAVNDYDYQNAIHAMGRAGGARRAQLDLLAKLPAYREPNHVYRNEGDLRFAEKTAAWGMDQPSLSYGAAYADLDNDGRLDLVVSNIDAPASIYHNVAPAGEGANHWLQVRLQSESPHQRGVGAWLTLTAGGRRQYLYHNPYRGYMSTMDDRAYFGLGAAPRVDTLEVAWPDGRRQVITGLQADRLVTVRQADARERRPVAPPPPSRDCVFEALDSARVPAYRHRVPTQPDYAVQPLLPYMLSRQGPALATGDADGDGLEDVFVGGGGGAPGQLFLQRKDGAFVASPVAQPWAAERPSEDWGALFFDANGDGRQDLYVASGGYAHAPSSRSLQDRLYVNQGGGRFVRDSAALPEMLGSTAAVRAGDFTGDGRPDLFVGGRLTPRDYPRPTRSYLLRNDGGRFVDVTAQLAPELVTPGGMITDAAWLDYDGDGRLDLATVGEWMPIELYRNDGRRLRRATDTRLPPLRGWWYSLAVGDFDEDGRPDLVAGNLGLNASWTTAPGARLGVHAGDFTGNGTTDVVMTQEVDGREYPIAGLPVLGRQIYSLSVRFPTAAAFASATMEEVFGAEFLKRGVRHQADSFASVMLRNEGGGAFAVRPLPGHAQIAPIRGAVVHDVDADGHLDALVAGNLFETEPNAPRLDAGNGLWLRGDGRGRFTPVLPAVSGFLAPRDVSGLALVATPAGPVVLVAHAGDALQAFRIRKR